MTPKLRTLALTVMTLGTVISAQGAVIVIGLGFEELAIQARNSNPAKPLGTPVLLANQISGFSFTGATVYHVDQTTAGDYATGGYPKPVRRIRNGVGFVQNRDGVNLGITNQTISVQLVGALANDDIESISFDLAIGAQPTLDLFAIGKDAVGADFRKLFGSISRGSSFEWRSLPAGPELDKLAGLGVTNRIEFVVRKIDDFIPAFALDNLNFTLAGTGGGTVPEPAGLGLVALALTAAGLTTRKRRA